MVLLVVISLVVYFSIGELIATSKWVKHTQEVIADGKELEKLMIDMETGETRFLAHRKKITFLNLIIMLSKFGMKKLRH